MNKALRLSIALLLFGLAAVASADQLLMIRSSLPFAEAMLALQNAISESGYKVARVQNVDIGLSKIGYKTDNYKVVFYGKAEEAARLVEKYPELIPYLPLNVAIFAEKDNTILVTNRPGVLAEFFPAPELKTLFMDWEKDLAKILNKVRDAR
ncbi:MAG: DUF302 domain-containing protein [Hydrogenophilales bacterium CG03_land_8_20_14_0_80_62_28]|nr:DUF302 domain-containing protein [Betaproteobacteria bacterium]OIO76959.1 MAG: DUF302 domain-containing protein [Hydrogenophilaceae bacterium CG1_02_62_390]PIV21600.1 MAG: DUF302 domain-containing protein [Hydrogenophilales bacterium CG03_land_8_20_14_0_80_62_28]PIW39663.1 MAG: DUF302 domain-containing protein [Hydrogenophilales bacterium CG15_BIG_FIL_POST_REV_8_21_14_020_62_31]PIW71992.1 MAG: DUF302 domain-containing protein [Hydrogenophilales bacterium CG12_big_fil_rev_8_21_14_0_65_61_21]